MFEDPAGTLLVIAVIAFTAPLITSLAPWVRLPALVLEIVLGIIVGPQVLGLVALTEPVEVISEIGLATLIFLAGFEIDPARVQGTPLKLAAGGWAMSVALGLTAGAVLQATGVIQSELYVGLALTTTALGTLIPILRDAGLLQRPIGTHLLAIGSVGEFFPIIAVALVLSGQRPARSALALGVFAVVAVIAIRRAGKPPSARFHRALESTLRSSGQLYIRGAMLLVAVMAYVASQLGLDFLLGAFTAGVIFRLIVATGADREETEQVETKLEALALGYLIPIFFVVTGIGFDLDSLISSPSALLKLPLFLGLLLVVRGLPAVLYRREIPDASQRRALALFSATGLPLIVAITTIGVESEQMRASTAAALVGAGMLSVVLFPMLGSSILRRGEPSGDRAAADAAT